MTMTLFVTGATAIACAECAKPAYYPARDVNTGRDIWAMCSECGHEINQCDILLEDGDRLVWLESGALGYFTESLEDGE